MLSVRIGGWRTRAAVLAGCSALTFAGCSLTGDSAFDAAAFRASHEAGDGDAVEEQGLRAIGEDAHIGKSKDEIRALLGSPDQATRNEWSWSVGTINDGIGVGDGGAFFLYFQGDRVTSAEVGIG
ncbi:MAG: hypothetical protein JHC84_09120 [Solirubrobacteraceae bacterium]|nr:hypothetical protein [Solirubrobacteraceae bacterium]